MNTPIRLVALSAADRARIARDYGLAAVPANVSRIPRGMSAWRYEADPASGHLRLVSTVTGASVTPTQAQRKAKSRRTAAETAARRRELPARVADGQTVARMARDLGVKDRTIRADLAVLDLVAVDGRQAGDRWRPGQAAMRAAAEARQAARGPEIVRRLEAGDKIRAIAADLRISGATIRKDLAALGLGGVAKATDRTRRLAISETRAAEVRAAYAEARRADPGLGLIAFCKAEGLRRGVSGRTIRIDLGKDAVRSTKSQPLGGTNGRRPEFS